MPTNTTTFISAFISGRRGIARGVLAALVAFAAAASAVTLGPQFEEKEQAPEREPVNLPPLRLAIPLFDANLPESERQQHKQGIWPELRKAETVRFPVEIKRVIDTRGRLSVIVTPDTSASADLYLIGKIEKSNGEDMWLSYQLIDATYRVWISEKTIKHRVPLGWHERYEVEEVDPFADVYEEIADDVMSKLDDQGKRHLRELRKKKRRMTNLERVTTTKDLVFATYFAPDAYSDTVGKSERDGYLEINHLPSQEDETWYKIQTIADRDERFSELISNQYLAFNDRMDATYNSWMRDAHPVAREVRIARRDRNIAGTLGAAAIVGAAVLATQENVGDIGESTGQKESRLERQNRTDLGATVLAIGGTVAIAGAFARNAEAQAMLEEINEIGRSVQGALKPMVVTLNNRTVTLTGTAQEQFTQWRSMLRDSYADTAFDAEAVQFAEEGESSE